MLKRHSSIYLNRHMLLTHQMTQRRNDYHVHTSSHRFEPIVWAIRLAPAYRCVRYTMEIFPPGWNGHLSRPQRNTDPADQRRMGGSRVYPGRGAHPTTETVAFAFGFLAGRTRAGR